MEADARSRTAGEFHGYVELLAALADPEHPEHDEYLEWIGGPVEPAMFSASSVRFDDPAKRWRIAFEGGAVVGGIVRVPAQWGGRAAIEGTRIPVFVIQDQFDAAGSIEVVLGAYPELKRADIHVALAYADLDRDGVAHDRQTYLDELPPGARIG